jgi:putative transcriptional regulator
MTPKYAKTLRDRRIGFDDGARIFEGPVVIWQDTRREYGEDRVRAVGESQGDVLQVVFNRRSAAVQIISVRRANRKEIDMAITRMTLDQIKVRPSRPNRAKIKATSEEEIHRHMIEDGQDPDEELREEDIISPWYIRKRLGMSQQEFADTLGIPVATLRNWEQNRVMMEPATIALMRILAYEPQAALRALRSRAAWPDCRGHGLLGRMMGIMREHMSAASGEGPS